MVARAAVIATLLLLAVTECFAGEPATEALTRDATLALIGALEFPADVEVAFEQSQRNPLFSRVKKQQGIMFKTAEQGLVMRITDPRAEERMLSAGAVSLTRRERNRHGPGTRDVTRRTQLDPARPSHLVLLTLEAVLNGDASSLTTHFSVSGERRQNGWEMQLEPIADTVREQLSRIWFRGAGHQLQQFRSERDDGEGGFSHFVELTMHPPADNVTRADAP